MAFFDRIGDRCKVIYLGGMDENDTQAIHELSIEELHQNFDRPLAFARGGVIFFRDRSCAFSWFREEAPAGKNQ